MDLNERENASVQSSEEDEKVVEIALSLVPAAEAFARRYQLSSDTGREAMMEAAKRIIESRAKGSESIEGIKNLPGYLFFVGRNLMLNELRRRRNEVDVEGLDWVPSETSSVESEILVAEIVRRMNPKARAIFRYRTFGYNYDEIAKEFRKMGYKATQASLRSEFSKAVKQIKGELKKTGTHP